VPGALPVYESTFGPTRVSTEAVVRGSADRSTSFGLSREATRTETAGKADGQEPCR